MGIRIGSPLTVAISRDSARTWDKIRDFETDVRFTYGYPSLTFVKDRAIVTYWAARDWPFWGKSQAQVRPFDMAL